MSGRDDLLEMLAKAKSIIRGYRGAPQTVIRGGRAMIMKPGNPFRASLRGGSADLMEAAGWTRKKLKRARKPKGPRDGVEKARLRLPSFRKPKNPFKAGSSATGAKTARAAKRLGAGAAFMAATPGAGWAGGALGSALGSAHGAAFGFAAGAAADTAAVASLGLAARRRGKAASFLARRGKRGSGIYKANS